MLIVTFVQPRDRLRFLSQTDIDGGDIVGCHIFLPRDHLELMRNAQGFVPVTCPRVRIPEPGHIERMSPRQPGRRLSLDDRLLQSALLNVSPPQIQVRYREVRVHLQSPLELVDGLVIVPLYIQNPTGNHAYGEREWVDLPSALYLCQSLIP